MKKPGKWGHSTFTQDNEITGSFFIYLEMRNDPFLQPCILQFFCSIAVLPDLNHKTKESFMIACFRSNALLLLFAGHQLVQAQGPERTHDITVEDYFTQSIVTKCVISPDGTKVAYDERRWQGPKASSNTDLWLVDCRSKEIQRLTFDPANDSNLRWSPDGKSIYFVSNRKREGEKSPPYNGTPQVWRLEVASGQEVPLTKVPDGINAFCLSPDGRSLYYTTSKKHITDDWKDLREDFPDLNYGHGVHQISELWKLNLQSWREIRLYDKQRYIRSFDVSPDEGRIALITTPDELEISSEGASRVDIVDIKNSTISTLPDELWRKNGPSPYGWLDDLLWSGNGKFLAFTVAYDGYPSELIVASWVGFDPLVRKMPRPKDVFVGGGVTWKGKSDDVCFLGDYHATKAVFAVRAVGSNQPLTEALTSGDLVIDSVSFSSTGGEMAVLQTGATYGRDIFLGNPGDKGERIRLTNLNPQIDTWKVPRIERLTWKGANGDEVEGILELPPNSKPGVPLPTIVNLHGGPKACDYVGFQFWPWGRTLLAAQGYAVFYPNYRGSTGYGDDFIVALVGRENDIEVKDIMAGIDALVLKKIADPDRLGVMGWSNGGYLTNCLITKSNRFKAASTGAGVFDMTIQWGEEDTPGHVINYQQGLPWQQAANYQKSSPLYQLRQPFETAVLIHAGESDERVPSTQSKALHRALHQYMKVRTELVLYPNAGHTLTEYKHRLAKMKWDLAWFEKYLPVKKK